MDITVPRQHIRRNRSEARPRMALYWAYGSNLSIDRMIRRCRQAEPVRGLYLNHARLVFRGVADITIAPRSEAAGGLWRITRDCEQSLDSFEGVSTKIYLKRFFTVSIDGEDEEVLFYQMSATRGIMPPSEEYLRTIETGYDDFGLDKAYIDEALGHSWSQTELTVAMRRRHDRQGRPRLARPIESFVLAESDLREAGAI